MSQFNFTKVGLDGKTVKSNNTDTSTKKSGKFNFKAVKPTARIIDNTPTAVGGIIRDITRPFATLAVRPYQLAKALGGASEEEQTVKSDYWGDIGTSRNASDVLKDVGRGAEVVSWGVGGGAVKNAAGKVVKQSLKQALPRLALEGAGAGALGAGGRSVSEGKPFKQVVEDTAEGAAYGIAGNVLFGTAANLLSKKGRALNKGAKWFQKEISPEKARLAAQKNSGYTYNKKGNTVVPEAQGVKRGTQSSKLNNQPGGEYDTFNGNVYKQGNELPTINFDEGGVEVPSQKAPSGYKYVPEKYSKAKETSGTVSNKVTSSNKIKPSSTAEEFLNQPKRPTPNNAPIQEGEVRKVTPEDKVTIESNKTRPSEKVLDDLYGVDSEADPEFVKANKQRDIEFFDTNILNNRQYIKDIALGNVEAPKGIRPDAINALLSEYGGLTGEEAIKLSRSIHSGSQSGSRLEANKLRSSSNIVRIIRGLNDALTEKLRKSKQVTNKTIKRLVEDMGCPE